MQSICTTLIFLFTFALGLQAQPTVFGTQLVNGSYATYDLADRGAFRQLRLQASSSGAGRNWEFASGTAAGTDYSNNWRPYTPGLTLSGFNAVIPPVGGTASALYNSSGGGGGASGLLPNITSGNYYTINVTENGLPNNNHMAILETAFAPATVTGVSGPACGGSCGYTVTVTLSNAPAAGEYAYVRYSTNNFTGSSLVQLSFSGATGTATIPNQGSSMVVYYVYTSTNTLAQINAAVAITGNGQLAHDMLTLELNNNGGANYSYGPCNLAVCQNITVQLDDMGNAGITADDVDGGSFDACGPLSLDVSQMDFTCADQITDTPTELFFSEYVEGSGDNKYLEIYNGTGAAVNLSNYQVRLYSNGTGSPSPSNTLSGILNPGQVLVLRNSGATAYLGASTAATAINFNGDDAVELYNTALGATADIFGRIGEDPGTAWTSGANTTVNKTLRRRSNVTGGVTSNPASGFPTLASEWDVLNIDDVSGLGSHALGVTVTLTGTGVGASASCLAVVTVEDATDPDIQCGTFSVNTDPGACTYTVKGTEFDPTYDDNCGVVSVSNDQTGTSPLAGAVLSLGGNAINWVVEDAAGNAGNCTVNVTVADNQAPTIDCPDDITLAVNGQCQVSVPDFTGGPAILANSVAGFSGVQGANGWQYGQYFAFQYQDFSQLPNYNGGAPQWEDVQPFSTPYLDAYGGHPGVDDLIWAVRRWVSPYTGTVDISLAFFDRDGACGDGAHVRVFLNGTQVWEYLNIPTSVVTQSFSQAIAAGDELDFVIDPKFDAGCDDTQFAALVAIPNGLSASDLCGGVSVQQNPAPGTLLGVGTTPITLTATDGNSNSENCTFNLTVVDNIAPTAACQPATVYLNAGGTGSITAADVFDAANSSDNCGTVNPQSVSPASFTCDNIGPNTVMLTVNDGNGNTSDCEATVTVIDGMAPTAVCKPASVQLDAFNMGSITAADVFDDVNSSDNCGTVNLQSVSPASFTCANIGSNTVTLTVNDGNGNTAGCMATVTVTENIAPTAACQPATVYLNAGGTGSITAADVFDAANSSDNCGTVNPQSVSPASFTCDNTGPNTVMLTVNDGNGNISDCEATVTVIDGMAPTAVCKPATVQLSAAGTGGITPADVFNASASSDNCGTVNPQSVSLGSFTCANIGPNTVMLTVNDGNGNTAACNATVTVQDNAAPTAACQPAIVQLSVGGTGSITPADVFNAAGSSDNCGTVNPQSVSPNSFGCADVGAIAVTLTVNDGNGNTSTCQASVTVEDPTGFCSQVFCFDSEVNQLKAYIKSLNLRSTVERNLTRRLDLAVDKFCDGASAATIIDYLENLIDYVQYHRGGNIPAAAADYILAELQAMIDALNAGTAQCCSGEDVITPPGIPGQVAEEAYQLEVFPNPSGGQAAIRFYLPQAGRASLELFNLQGQRVRLLEAALLEAGSHERSWDGKAEGGQDLASGAYLLRLRTESTVMVKKVSLMR